ncbi:MAG: hypothetical protein GX181_02210 [Synergistaceae bacterium]|nr:hypothetical protein [Synergistota bacterium]NLM70761.1 hypothetical protein [Synergistaceae bacterium]
MPVGKGEPFSPENVRTPKRRPAFVEPRITVEYSKCIYREKRFKYEILFGIQCFKGASPSITIQGRCCRCSRVYRN